MANKVHIVLLLIVFSFLSISKLSFPQYDEVIFEHLTIADGIPGNSISCILQDHLGYLWLGTRNGLVKYDGHTMKVYQPIPNDSTSISSRAIRVLYEDKSGDLWIGASWQSEGGLNRFDRATETFTRYIYNTNDSNSLNSNPVNSIYEDRKGRLWIGTNKGLNLFIPESNGFVHYYIEDSESLQDSSFNFKEFNSISITAITEDPITGNLLIGSSLPGIWKFDVNSKKFSKYDLNNINQTFNLTSINSFFEEKDSSIWMSTYRGLGHFYPKKNQLQFYQIIPTTEYNPVNSFISLLVDRDENVWIGTSGEGLVRFNSRTEQFQRFHHDAHNSTSLSGEYVLSLFEDNSGILWVGTHWWGLDKWDRKKHKFKHYSYNSRNPESLGENWVTFICEDHSGTVWVGTRNGGLNQLDREKNIFKHYKHNPQNANSISNDSISWIVEDTFEPGVLWIGTENNGLDKFDMETSKFVHFNNDPNDTNSISSNNIRSIFIDHLGVLWIGTLDDGLNQYDRVTGKFIRYQNNPNDPTSLSHNTVNIIYEDGEGVLWIGTDEGGICRFDPNTGKFTTYRSLTEDQDVSIIMSIFEDSKRNFWVGTYKTGIHLFDRSKGISIKNYDERDGLANNLVCAILENDSGNLWISTANGLSKFNPLKQTFRNYGISDGLDGSYFNRRSAFKCKNGEMFFGGEFGLNVFHPDSIKDDPVPPQVVISNISLFNKPGKKIKFNGFISELNEVNLSYDQNDLRFDYIGLHFSEPTKNNYKYMLEGFDGDWIDAGTQRNATYTNLDPGEYIFRVKAANRDGIWNEQGVSLKVIILPPWWATTWAYFIYAVLIMGIIYYTWKLQLKRIKIKQDYEMSKFEAEKMHEVDGMKSRFFANISHEFRTPLTLIFGPAKDIVDETNESKTKQNAGLIKRNASRLYGLVNQLLDLSKLEAGKMNLEASEQNVMPLLKGLVLSFTSLAERKNITLKFNTIEENLNVYIDKDKVEKIITNLLSNAFKFTSEGGNIDFTVEKLIKEAEIRISDNGVGIPKERIDKIFDRFFQVDGSHTRESEGTGIGLALTKELVELHKGKIKVESKEGEGTTFTVLLPLGKEHLKPEEIVEKEIQDDAEVIVGETKLIPETENRKEKTDIDILIDSDKPLLLIVEDSSDVRKYIISHLEGDYRIQEAVDGEDGLAQALNHIPDLIISDVMMPKMDGFELCEKLKTDERTSHIPIILLTAKATSKDKIEGYETGADDYIMKPFDATELKVRIKNLIKQRERIHEHFKEQGIIEFEKQKITSIDKKFLLKIFNGIGKHISDSSFSVEVLVSDLGISRSVLHRKTVSLTGETPGELIRRIRLKKAADLIEQRYGNISEVALEVGFNNPAYFSECFKKQFGLPPSQYQQNNSKI